LVLVWRRWASSAVAFSPLGFLDAPVAGLWRGFFRSYGEGYVMVGELPMLERGWCKCAAYANTHFGVLTNSSFQALAFELRLLSSTIDPYLSLLLPSACLETLAALLLYISVSILSRGS
jgi:hypothetical protein